MIFRWYRGLAAALLLAALVCSAEIPRRDLRATAQVAGIALDLEGDCIKATFEVYRPSASAPIGTERELVSGYGTDLFACVENASLRHGNQLFLKNASVIILGGEGQEVLTEAVLSYYSRLENVRLDLPMVFADGQRAGAVFEGAERVLSVELAQSLKATGRRQTIKNQMNGVGGRVVIKGEGRYEIIS